MSMTADVPPVGTRCMAKPISGDSWQPIEIIWIGNQSFVFETSDGKEIQAKKPEVWIFKPNPYLPGGRYKLKRVRDLTNGTVVYFDDKIRVIKGNYAQKPYKKHGSREMTEHTNAVYFYDCDRWILYPDMYVPVRIDL